MNKSVVVYSVVVIVGYIINVLCAEEDLFLDRFEHYQQEFVKNNSSVPGIKFCYITKHPDETCKECDIVYRYVHYLAVKKALRPDLEVAVNSLQELHCIVTDSDGVPEFLGQAHHEIMVLAHALQKRRLTTSEYTDLIAEATLLWNRFHKQDSPL